ncbi:nucleic acid-binding, OB-fold protein [Tanacetum coccineum]
MAGTTITSLEIGKEGYVIEARVYRKWTSKSVPDMKEIAFCCILIDRENNAVQANMDVRKTEYFNSKLKLNTVYRISNFICENTKPYQQTLQNSISLKFGKITTFEVLPGKESEFPNHHFELISYNQLPSRVPYLDEETSRMVYPILSDVQLVETPATHYYVNPRFQEALDAYKISFTTMVGTTITSLRVDKEDWFIEAKVYQKWTSKSIPDMKEIAFCCILIDQENNAVQASMDVKNTEYFNRKLKLNTVYRISNFIYYLGCIRSISDLAPSGDANTGQKYRRKVDIESLDGNVVQFTMFDDLAKQFNKQEIDKLPHHVIIAVSSCRVSRYRGGDVQLVETPATHYYINHDSKKQQMPTHCKFKEKYNQNPPLQVINYRYQDPEQEKARNRQTLYTLLQQNPASFKDVRFTCDAMITSFNERKSWSYPSCSQCKKLSTKRNGIDTCEDHGKQIPPTYRYNFKATVADGTTTAEFTFFTEVGQKIIGHSCSDVMQKFEATDKTKLPVELVNTIGKNHIFQIQFSPNTQKGAGRFIVNDVLDIQPTNEQGNAGLMTHASINKDKGADTQLATSTILTIQDSTSKDSSMPGM